MLSDSIGHIVPISIHALREEGDYYNAMDTQSQTIFLSTPSARRATSNLTAYALEQVEFLSTPSARRATAKERASFHAPGISIHALREEGDVHHRNGHFVHLQFLSTPSARRATKTRYKSEINQWRFLSTPSARRATSARHSLA